MSATIDLSMTHRVEILDPKRAIEGVSARLVYAERSLEALQTYLNDHIIERANELEDSSLQNGSDELYALLECLKNEVGACATILEAAGDALTLTSPPFSKHPAYTPAPIGKATQLLREQVAAEKREV